jgi:hypothetical protein
MHELRSRPLLVDGARGGYLSGLHAGPLLHLCADVFHRDQLAVYVVPSRLLARPQHIGVSAVHPSRPLHLAAHLHQHDRFPVYGVRERLRPDQHWPRKHVRAPADGNANP